MLEVALGWDFGDPESNVPIPGIGDGDFSFWARKSPGIGDLECPKILCKNPEEIFEIPGIYIPEIGDFFSWDGISHQKATSDSSWYWKTVRGSEKSLVSNYWSQTTQNLSVQVLFRDMKGQWGLIKKKLDFFTLETSKNHLIRNFLRNGRVRVNVL